MSELKSEFDNARILMSLGRRVRLVVKNLGGGSYESRDGSSRSFDALYEWWFRDDEYRDICRVSSAVDQEMLDRRLSGHGQDSDVRLAILQHTQDVSKREFQVALQSAKVSGTGTDLTWVLEGGGFTRHVKENDKVTGLYWGSGTGQIEGLPPLPVCDLGSMIEPQQKIEPWAPAVQWRVK